MKRLIILLLACVMLFGTVNALALTEADPSSDRGITPKGMLEDGTFAPNPVIEGESPTTGEAWTGDYIPVLVNIDNMKPARPQWGIGKADIIYEMPIDGIGYTRLMALFSNQYPETAGPVRSARVMHAELRQEWNAAWAFVGGQTASGSNVFSAINRLGVYEQDVNLIFNQQGKNGARFFHDREDRKSPHHHEVQLNELVPYLAETGFDFAERPFLFTDEKAQGDAATHVTTDFGSGHSDAYYVYDAEADHYARYNVEDDAPYVDANDPDTTLAYENIIVQWTTLKYNGASNCPLLTEVGEGNADFFMNGVHVEGYWVRPDVNHRTVFFDKDGNELKLQRGRTWIVMASEKFLDVLYE